MSEIKVSDVTEIKYQGGSATQFSIIGTRGIPYNVVFGRSDHYCTCPSFCYRKGDCKHILFLRQKMKQHMCDDGIDDTGFDTDYDLAWFYLMSHNYIGKVVDYGKVKAKRRPRYLDWQRANIAKRRRKQYK